MNEINFIEESPIDLMLAKLSGGRSQKDVSNNQEVNLRLLSMKYWRWIWCNFELGELLKPFLRKTYSWPGNDLHSRWDRIQLSTFVIIWLFFFRHPVEVWKRWPRVFWARWRWWWCWSYYWWWILCRKVFIHFLVIHSFSFHCDL